MDEKITYFVKKLKKKIFMNKKKSKERYMGFPSEKTKTRMFRKKSS